MQKPRILIVEDEAVVALDLESQVIQLGYEPLAIVASGEDAVERALEQQPDLLLMDIRLAGEIDGIAAVEQIRQQVDIPVVFVTAYGNDQTQLHAMELGPQGYLVKPIDDKDLATVLEEILGR